MNMIFKLCISSLLLILFSIQVRIINASITQEEFNSAVTSNGYLVPKNEVYRNFIDTVGNFSREEVAMFIAQLIHESRGFKYTEQLDKGKYNNGYGIRGKNYHGRGFIQLTWSTNYKMASEALGLNDRLLKYPEDVANDIRIAMLVSVWYWNARVRPLLKGKEHFFGVTTKGINPGECIKSGYHITARCRYNIYLKVANALKINNKAKENGCYN